MADKMLLMASFVTLTYLKALPFWITAVVITRDAMLLVGALIVHMVGVRIYPRPTWVGKAATFTASGQQTDLPTGSASLHAS